MGVCRRGREGSHRPPAWSHTRAPRARDRARPALRGPHLQRHAEGLEREALLVLLAVHRHERPRVAIQVAVALRDAFGVRARGEAAVVRGGRVGEALGTWAGAAGGGAGGAQEARTWKWAANAASRLSTSCALMVTAIRAVVAPHPLCRGQWRFGSHVLTTQSRDSP